MICYNHFHKAITECFGEDADNATLTPVSGGDINEAFRVDIGTTRLFAKRNQRQRLADFEDECAGLQALANSQIAVAKPRALVADDNHAWLLLDWVESGNKTAAFWTHFGTQLAQMHQTLTAEQFGWQQQWKDHWIDYFRDDKLLPKFEQAYAVLDTRMRRLGESLMQKLDNRLLAPPQPQLIHGDLWHGNFMTTTQGQAVLIDPHAYYGHGEADLALTQLFGGFDTAFYQAYAQTYGLEAGFAERADIYNLYHLLNHLNLFGHGYLSACQRIIRKYG